MASLLKRLTEYQLKLMIESFYRKEHYVRKMQRKEKMKAILTGLWRALRITMAGAIVIIIALPADKWFTKETLLILITAFVSGVFKFLRDEYKLDIKVL